MGVKKEGDRVKESERSEGVNERNRETEKREKEKKREMCMCQMRE